MLLNGIRQMTVIRSNRNNYPSVQEQRGVGLIDVMIAIIIFSFGMLAIAALQNISKQSNYEAIQRTTASTLAYDLLERMRMNSVDMTVSPLSYYVSSGITTIDANDITVNGSTLTTPVSCAASDMDCNYQQRAQLDLLEWQNRMRGASEVSSDDTNVGGLFRPVACLTGPGFGDSGAYTLTIAWRGQVKLENQSTTNECGKDSGLYDADASNDFAYRRILVLNTYLHE